MTDQTGVSLTASRLGFSSSQLPCTTPAHPGCSDTLSHAAAAVAVTLTRQRRRHSWFLLHVTGVLLEVRTLSDFPVKSHAGAAVLDESPYLLLLPST